MLNLTNYKQFARDYTKLFRLLEGCIDEFVEIHEGKNEANSYKHFVVISEISADSVYVNYDDKWDDKQYIYIPWRFILDVEYRKEYAIQIANERKEKLAKEKTERKERLAKQKVLDLASRKELYLKLKEEFDGKG